MGLTGRWLDRQDEVAKDRVVRHPDPMFRGEEYIDTSTGCCCLVGAVMGLTPDNYNIRLKFLHPAAERVARKFPRLTRRFGPERIWRACKLRAGASLDDLEPQPEREAVWAK